MEGGLLGGWGAVLLLLAGIVYQLIIQAASKKEERSAHLSPAEQLAQIARKQGGSEYDIFRKAALEWNEPESRIDDDFKRYLNEEIIPYYVNGYIREKEEKDQ